MARRLQLLPYSSAARRHLPGVRDSATRADRDGAVPLDTRLDEDMPR